MNIKNNKQVCYVCIADGKHVHYNSIAYKRKDSIKKLEDSSGDMMIGWNTFKKFGFKYIKINAEVSKVNN
jgi:hypothetical protein